jgi:N-acetylmuramoyl-L-alanine amidase
MHVFIPAVLIVGLTVLACVVQSTHAAVAPPPPVGDFCVDLVEAVILAEARGEGPQGMTAVADVIRNRMRKHHTTAHLVVVQQGQFACLNNLATRELIYNAAAWKPNLVARDLAIKLVDHNGFGVPRITNGATHFYRAGQRPEWAGQMNFTVEIGNHRFYR